MYKNLLGNRNFVALWIGQAVSAIGDYFTLLAIPIFVNRLTGSVMLVGLSFISTALPALILGPVAGVFVDRLDRRKVMIVSDLLRGGLTLSLLTIHTANQVWILYLAGFLIACASQFFTPSRGAVLPLIVTDTQDWLAANSSMRIIQTIGMLGGPTLAGFAIGQWGERIAFLADGTSFFASELAVTPMQSALDTIMQIAVPDLKRGRVGSSMNAATTAIGLFSMALASMFGEAIGLHSIFLIVGFFVLASGLLGFWLLREPEEVKGELVTEPDSR